MSINPSSRILFEVLQNQKMVKFCLMVKLVGLRSIHYFSRGMGAGDLDCWLYSDCVIN